MEEFIVFVEWVGGDKEWWVVSTEWEAQRYVQRLLGSFAVESAGFSAVVVH